ncbi:uncharacterized protein LOC116773337 [Danaus plexippus]|uniref:MICOS complex subunit MIC13 n=1 Tax=Danaus plexippus plexippus TaxID=278856 RepID=A0A212EZQ7_DANPL|nr:uncharacterized protein LOC116773337 [Danaus plexippus]OWR46979.1 hypothetical protein KGM_214623 [Danaus plexippus plexippus]
MCENLSQDRIRCEACRTINLAKNVNQPKPDMQIYEKCSPTQKICSRVPELPIHPTCIKVCSKEEYKLRKSGKKLTLPVKTVPCPHGKLMYAVKAGILVGAVYFTYTQGVWGDQRDVTECIRRWQEYIRSINTRRPPVFDQCGNVIKKESSESIIAPMYLIYKRIVTTCFEGIVKFPMILKCAYIDYIKALERRQAELDQERKIRKRSI